MTSIKDLRAELCALDSAYRQGHAQVTDLEFDMKKAKLAALAPHAPELKVPGGGTHLLSLDNQMPEAWWMTLPQSTAVVVQPKIDGCAIGLRYRNGVLEAAWTRSGRSAMPVVDLVPSVPKVLREESEGLTEVHGELYGVERLTSQQRAAAALRRTRPSGDGLLFSAYKLVNSLSSESCSQVALGKMGFDTPDTIVCTSLVEVRELHQRWLRGAIFEQWPTDGIVVKVFDQRVQRKLGCNSVAPRWALAIKRYG